LGTISGIKSVYPTKRLGVVWIDVPFAFAYTSPSGNIHGMPCQRLWEKIILIAKSTKSPDTAQHWEDLKYWCSGIKNTKFNLFWSPRLKRQRQK
jgi:arginase